MLQAIRNLSRKLVQGTGFYLRPHLLRLNHSTHALLRRVDAFMFQLIFW